ncbi:uncharacterized protein LOC118644870 [Monomorium pharaonis]|uniref:uncharacterized protein LOC118644870 n=1 Tax=Monomorium pharaonis TaxID=307658 RepID=UPI001746586A|nr:uncharacterized protein LOC118644870 [Monomorium pharaonis]
MLSLFVLAPPTPSACTSELKSNMIVVVVRFLLVIGMFYTVRTSIERPKDVKRMSCGYPQYPLRTSWMSYGYPCAVWDKMYVVKEVKCLYIQSVSVRDNLVSKAANHIKNTIRFVSIHFYKIYDCVIAVSFGT